MEFIQISTLDRQLIPTSSSRSARQGRHIPDPYAVRVAHVAGWEPCSLHDLGHDSWVGSVLL